MPARYVLTKSTGGYHFNLVATNGEVIASSETYTSKSGALNGIESVRQNAPDATVDDRTGEARA
jgi:uncharacterized protein YegP (UPF0339 family)